jgi:hypothetical protein
MATIGYARVQQYLTAIAQANGLIGSSPHGAFWLIEYDAFITGALPTVTYRGAPIPLILKEAPLLSPFFMILVEPKGWGGKRQMPPGGPNISTDGLDIALDDGTTVKSQQIRADLENWLKNGFPKDPIP